MEKHKCTPKRVTWHSWCGGSMSLAEMDFQVRTPLYPVCWSIVLNKAALPLTVLNGRKGNEQSKFPCPGTNLQWLSWTTKWRHFISLIRKMTKDISKSVRHYFSLELPVIAVISLPQLVPPEGFGTVLGRRPFYFQVYWNKFLQFSLKVRQNQLPGLEDYWSPIPTASSQRYIHSYILTLKYLPPGSSWLIVRGAGP